MAKILIQQPECMALLISAAYVSKQNAATVGFHDFLHIEGTPAPAKTCYSGKSQEALPLNDPEAQADLQNRIRQRAHRLWEAEGSPAGRLEEYWLRAQELIDDESRSAYPPAQSRGNRT